MAQVKKYEPPTTVVRVRKELEQALREVAAKLNFDPHELRNLALAVGLTVLVFGMRLKNSDNVYEIANDIVQAVRNTATLSSVV